MVSDANTVTKFEVMDPDINFSDHLPIMISCMCSFSCGNSTVTADSAAKLCKMSVPQLRWDHADLGLYKFITGSHLQSVLQETVCLERSASIQPEEIDNIYGRILNLLRDTSDAVVPACRKNFFRYW